MKLLIVSLLIGTFGAQFSYAFPCKGNGIEIDLLPEQRTITFKVANQNPVKERIVDTVDLPDVVENGIQKAGGFVHITEKGNRFELAIHNVETVIYKGTRYSVKCEDPSDERE